MTKHQEWFNSTVGDDTINAAASKANVNQPTLNRRLKSGELTAELVISIARAYGANPVQALIETGYLDTDEARGTVTISKLADASDQELMQEMLRRIDTGKQISELWDKPLDSGTITEIHKGATELRAVRNENTSEPGSKLNPERENMAAGRSTLDEDTDFGD